MRFQATLPASRHAVLAATLALLALFAPALWSQATTQSVQGLVTDATGAVIPGAQVTLTNRDTGVARALTSNESGYYSFSLVPVGNYDIRCQSDGFKTEAASAVRVET